MNIMGISEVKMGKFLKQNILDTVAKKYRYAPDRSTRYLKGVNEQLTQVQELVQETLIYMAKVKRIKDEESGVKYPFKEGDDYWTIENGEVIKSCWDHESEELYRENPHQMYYQTEKDAINFLNESNVKTKQ